jgi:signal transduction histidine kinase
MARFSFSSLRVRLLLLVMLAMVPSLGMIVYTAWEQRRLSTVKVQEDALRLARLIASEKKQSIEGGRQLLISLAQLPEVRRHDSRTCGAFFADIVRRFPLYVNLIAAKPDGDIFCSGAPLSGLVNVADRIYFQHAMISRDFTVGEYQIGRITNKPMLALAYPSVDDLGVVRAIVSAGLDLSWFNRIAAESQLPQGSTFTMIDRKGVVLARYPEPEKWIGKSVPEAPVVQSILAQEQGTVEAAGLDGNPRLYGFARLQGIPHEGQVYVSIGIPKEVAFAAANRILARNLAWLGIAGVLTLVAAWLGSNLFVLRRVNSLVGATKRLGSGDLSARTGLPYREDEISQLAQTIDEMAGSLERQRKESLALREITRAITSTLDLHHVLDVLLEKIDMFLPYSAATVRLLNKESGLLEPIACRNLDEKRWKVQKWDPRHGLGNILLRDKVPLVVRDLRTDPRTGNSEFLREQGLISYLGVPLTAKDMILGTLAFYTKVEHEFTNEEVEFLTALAGEAAVAIYNSQLYEQTKNQAVENTALLVQLRARMTQLQEANRHLSTLYSISTVINQSLDIEVLLHNAMHKLLEIFNFDAGRIYLLNQNGNELRLVAYEGFPKNALPPSSYQPDKGLMGRIFATGEPVFFKDIQDDLEFHRLSQNRVMLKAGFRAQFSTSIRIKNKTIGVLNFVSKNVREFLPGDVDLMRSMADHLGIAVENASLFSEVKQKTVELEKANKVKSEFLSVMSHELRTPINVILGYAELIKDGSIGEINSEQKKILERIRSCSQELLKMINGMLEATRLEAEATKAESYELDLGNFLDELRLAYEAPLDKEITLIWDYPTELPVIRTDGEKLKHILQNLVNNAIKFTDNGSVTVTARYLSGTEAVRFGVTDTGVGIPKESLPIIFDMFRQLDSSEKRAYGGVGMGLYIVKKFTELLGGTVEVESEPSKGSTFTVTIPCER